MATAAPLLLFFPSPCQIMLPVCSSPSRRYKTLERESFCSCSIRSYSHKAKMMFWLSKQTGIFPFCCRRGRKSLSPGWRLTCFLCRLALNAPVRDHCQITQNTSQFHNSDQSECICHIPLSRSDLRRPAGPWKEVQSWNRKELEVQLGKSASDVVAAAGQAGSNADTGLQPAQGQVRKRWQK